MRALVVALALANAVSCASSEKNPRLTEYESTLGPRIGQASREDIVEIYGQPQDRQTLGISEVWTYVIVYSSSPSLGSTSIPGPPMDMHDELRLTFDSRGILRKWRVRVPQ